MTFRSRVIATTVAAAAIALVLGCFASYLSTRNALFHSVDESLLQAAHDDYDHDDQITGAYSFIVLADGETLPATTVPLDATIMSVAKGKSPQVLRTVEIGTDSYRELIVPVTKGSVVPCGPQPCQLTSSAAQLLLVNVTGQVDQLHDLLTTLLAIVTGGLLIAFGLGVTLARAALHPLEEVTGEIETVAESNNLGHRLDEGANDELGRLRRTFNRLLGSVERSSNLQRQLIVDASHELRTPLTSLRTNAQVIARGGDLPDEERHQIADDIVAQVDELAALIDDLGELAQGERVDLTRELVHLDECVDDCVATARTHARIKDITIEADVEPSVVSARHDRIQRAVNNLLTNAVKFTPEGGQIRVTSRHGNVVVADSGSGVAEDDRAHVFDRFWRSPSARALPGSGLGLSIVAQVVRDYDGTVSVDRDPALGGARFTIRFPEITENPFNDDDI